MARMAACPICWSEVEVVKVWWSRRWRVEPHPFPIPASTPPETLARIHKRPCAGTGLAISDLDVRLLSAPELKPSPPALTGPLTVACRKCGAAHGEACRSVVQVKGLVCAHPARLQDWFR